MSVLKPHISLFDKSYAKSKANEYKLYMQVSKNGLKYTLLDTSKNTFVAFEEYQFQDIYSEYALVNPIKEVLACNPIFKNKFECFYVSYVNNRATLIPNALYKQEELKNYHQFNYTDKEEYLYFSDQLINLSAHNIYSIPDFIHSLFSNIHQIKFKHFSSILIETALIAAKNESSISLVEVHVLPSEFQIIIIKDQKLNLYNTFAYQTSEDFIYYLLFVLEQHNINNQEVTIKLSGEVEKNSAIFSMLNKYIQTTNFKERPTNLKFSYIFEEMPSQFHHALFNQVLCE